MPIPKQIELVHD